jgi:nucleoside-diphosphate-sugar epimerase
MTETINILLTGSNGFLGSAIKKHFDEKKLNYYTLGRSNANILCDLKLPIEVSFQNFDLIIHAAGKAHSTPNTIFETKEFFDVNVNGTLNLLNGLESMSCLPKKFVFISSVSVYGLIKGLNINEENPLLAIDPYGQSKIEAEIILKKWCEDHNVICTILRLPLILGSNPPGNLRSMINAIKNGYYFNIAGGNAKKSMVLASDIAKYILKAAEVGGTYNLTDGVHPSFNEFSKSISRNLGKSFVPNMPHFIAFVLAKFGDFFGNNFPLNSNKLAKITSTLTFNDTKARIAFGWNPSPVLESFKLNKDAR